MNEMEYLCAFCGSSERAGSVYGHAIDRFAAVCLKRDIGLVYGGASDGLMGKLADSILDGGGEVVGVIPETILETETPHESLTELEITETKTLRKERMMQLADGFVALPGGLGTQEELFTVLGRAKHGMHGKPVGCLDVAGYYGSMVAFLDNAVREGFVSTEQRSLIVVERDPDALLDAFDRYRSPVASE